MGEFFQVPQDAFPDEDEEEDGELDAPALERKLLQATRLSTKDRDWIETNSKVQFLVDSLEGILASVDLFHQGNSSRDKLIRLSDGSYIHIQVQTHWDQDGLAAYHLTAGEAGDLVKKEQDRLREEIEERQTLLRGMETFVAKR